MNSFLCWLLKMHEPGIVLAKTTWILPSSPCLPTENIQAGRVQNEQVGEGNELLLQNWHCLARV